MRITFSLRAVCPILLIVGLFPISARAEEKIRVSETSDIITIETDALSAVIRKTGYVSGVKANTLIDKKTGAHDLGFGLHIQDWLMAPGWGDDGYPRDPKLHGNLPKHTVEGPQICTKAKVVPTTIIHGDGFVAVKMHFAYTEAGAGFKPGSLWEQTIIFQPGLRYFLSCETITSVNDADDLFYRLDMPGHIKHKGADTFEQVYLSYRDGMIPASAFSENFGPDEKFLYQRNDKAIPERMIRAYQVKLDGKPGPWLAGMTLDPAEVSEAWCHERGYVCFIEELHKRHVKAGETFGAAYCIGWFDDVPEMHKVYDRYKGTKGIKVEAGKFALEK
jgi:hypothetical protein